MYIERILVFLIGLSIGISWTQLYLKFYYRKNPPTPDTLTTDEAKAQTRINLENLGRLKIGDTVNIEMPNFGMRQFVFNEIEFIVDDPREAETSVICTFKETGKDFRI